MNICAVDKPSTSSAIVNKLSSNLETILQEPLMNPISKKGLLKNSSKKIENAEKNTDNVILPEQKKRNIYEKFKRLSSI
jgi:hypothetical protein